MSEPEVELDKPTLDIEHGYSRVFAVTAAGELVTGRLVFGFRGDRSCRLFHVIADFDSDGREPFTLRHRDAVQAVLPIKDEEVAADFIVNALKHEGESYGPTVGAPVNFH